MDPRAGIGLSDEHLALADAARSWASRHCPPDVVRAGLDADVEGRPPFWDELAGQGWLGLAVGEDAGGEGFSVA
ncbi:MAG TPA: acyl-CoA dehydrogenase family protein, partial [Acidimicrobiales bacterium]|nr:acyl-CoA dehydrogenase family protein [Acidimicrobiales bacterium]